MNISKETQSSLNRTNLKEFSMPPLDVPIYVLNFLFGVPIHSYVLWLLVTATERGIASEIFTFNISVCELIVCLRSVIGVTAHKITTLKNVEYFLSGFVTTGHFFQCLICVERYLAVVHPVTFLKFKPLRYRVACCCFVWIMISIFCILNVRLVHSDGFHIFTGLNMSQFLLFFSINLFCCVAVLRVLKHSGPGERGRDREEENQMKRRAFYIIIIITLTLTITYVPGCITSFLLLLSVPNAQELSSMSQSCFSLAGLVQPLLYIHRVQKLPVCMTF